MRTISRLTISALALSGSVAFAPAAFAQDACAYPFDPADPACGGVGDVVVERDPADPADRADPARAEVAQQDTVLPFTGSSDIALLGLAAGGAVAGGVALVALGRRRRDA